MLVVVMMNSKVYYAREFTGTGITVKKNEEDKFMLCLDDRPEPIAIYKNAINANNAMVEIVQAFEKDKKVVAIPPIDIEGGK